MKKKRNKKLKKKLKSFGSLVFKLATIVIAAASIIVIMKTNQITNTANLLQINDAIQQRTDIVFAAGQKIDEYVSAQSSDNNSVDWDKSDRLSNEYAAAITSLLNTYEFACSQYLDNKIDKKAFKTFYILSIKYIKADYPAFFETADGVGYSAINEVHRQWYGK